MTNPDPYDQFLAEVLAEWAATDEDAEYRRYYPQATDPKENNR